MKRRIFLTLAAAAAGVLFAAPVAQAAIRSRSAFS